MKSNKLQFTNSEIGRCLYKRWTYSFKERKLRKKHYLFMTNSYPLKKLINVKKNMITIIKIPEILIKFKDKVELKRFRLLFASLNRRWSSLGTIECRFGRQHIENKLNQNKSHNQQKKTSLLLLWDLYQSTFECVRGQKVSLRLKIL